MQPDGTTQQIEGLFGAISFDEGNTWPIIKCISSTQEITNVRTLGSSITLDKTHGEKFGYLAATQSPDGIIHLISSFNHYRFNLEWLLDGHNA